MIEIKNGNLDDFFESAMQTAKEIDEHRLVTRKQTIWMSTDDLLALLKPARTKLLKYLKGKSKIYYSVMLKELHKSPASLNKDLDLLVKYQLIDITKEVNPSHGIYKVIQPLFGDQELEFKAVV